MMKAIPSHKELLSEDGFTKTYSYRRMYTKSGFLPVMTLFEATTGMKPDYSILWVFKSKAFVRTTKVKCKQELSAKIVSGHLRGLSYGRLYCVLVKSGSGWRKVLSKDITFDSMCLKLNECSQSSRLDL